MRAIAASIAAFALTRPVQAADDADNKVSPQQFDVACAVVAG